MKHAFFLSTTFAALLLAACTPHSEIADRDTDTSDMTENTSDMDFGLDAGNPDGDNAGVMADPAPADDFLNGTEIATYEAGEREGLSMDSLAGALAGESFYVAFDTCPYDDTGWQEGNDPLAGIRCGYSYFASQNDDGDLVFTGPLEPLGSIFTAPGAISEDGVTVWGVSFGVRLDGTIVDGSDNEVGHIGLGEAR